MHRPSENHPVLNIALPLLLWMPVLALVAYGLYRFAYNFDFYHPIHHGPFLPL